MQGPDPSLAYRPNLETDKTKEKEDYRNFKVSIQSSPSDDDTYLLLRSFMARGVNPEVRNTLLLHVWEGYNYAKTLCNNQKYK